MLFGMALWRQRFGWLIAVWAVCGIGCGDGISPVTEGEARPDGRGLRGTLGARAGADAGFAKAEAVRSFSFPLDHGPHTRFRSEWWYLTAVLAGEDGREFGIQFTVFRQGIAPVESAQAVAAGGAAAWRTGQVYLGHVAVSDVAQRRHLEAERLARGHPSLAGARATPFAVHVEGWRLASVTSAAFWPLRLQAAAADFAIDLTLTGGKPIVLQGERGFSRKGPNNASYYYSIPRIDAHGRLVVAGQTHTVAGGAWLDREWSTSVLAPAYAGWDWFALRLDDGRDVMLYRMRRTDGQPSGYDAGALIDAAGAARILAAGDFSLRPQASWRGWPIAWRLTLPGEPAPWTVEAAFADQLMDTSIRYWEGVAHVRGANGNRIGAGYMELTGY